MAHPPRSNPPLRSSSDPPSSCIPPSTETFVVIVSFMIVVPISFGFVPLGRPSWAASHPCYEHLCHDPTPPPGCLSRTFWYAGCKRSDSATVSGRLRSTSSCAPSADEFWYQIDREAPDSSSSHAAWWAWGSAAPASTCEVSVASVNRPSRDASAQCV